MKKIIGIGAALMVLMTLAAVSVSAAYNDASVRVLHASPDAPNVDIWVEGTKAIPDLEFNELSETAMLPKGQYNIQVVPEGETEPVVIDADLRLKQKFMYTVAAINYLDNIEPLVLEDSPGYVPVSKASVRFVHASPDAPNVDIGVKGGSDLFRNVAFKEVERYIRVPGGSYELEVKVAGTDTVALTVPVTVENGVAYTIFATGTLADENLGAKVLVDKESNMKKWLEGGWN